MGFFVSVIIRAMDKFFSIFGKVALALVVVGGIAYGAYSFGLNVTSKNSGGAASTTASPAPTTDPGLRPETLPSDMTTPTPKAAKTIKAGLDASSGLSFTKYQINVLGGWTESHSTTNEGTWVDTLTLTKGTAQLKIFQAATGGAMCLYTDDPDFEGPSSRYDSFGEITTSDNVILRRGWNTTDNGTTKGFTFCQKGTESFGQPTVFGHMSLTTPANPDGAILEEVDAMVASLTKIK